MRVASPEERAKASGLGSWFMILSGVLAVVAILVFVDD